ALAAVVLPVAIGAKPRLCKIQGHCVFAARNGNRVAEVAVPFPCIELRIGGTGNGFFMRSQTAANIVVVGTPEVPFMIREGQIMRTDTNGGNTSGLGGKQLQPVQEGCAVGGCKPEMHR